MKNTFISFIVIGLIFLYWYKKRATKYGVECANLWENIKNPHARTIFFNALSSTENDADLKSTLVQQSAQAGWNIDYTNCKYALKYIQTHGNEGYQSKTSTSNVHDDTNVIDQIMPMTLATESEIQQIDKCICGKYLTA